MRAPAVLLLAGLASACAKSDAADDSDLRVEPITISADRLESGSVVNGNLVYRGGFSLSAPGLGGLSAADVNQSGDVLTAASDNGNWYRFRLASNPAGDLIDVQLDASGQLLGEDGAAFRTKGAGDAESIARQEDGRLVVGFESQSKVLIYPSDLASRPVRGDLPPGVRSGNAGLEAMTLTEDGRIVAFSEGGPRLGGRGPAWIGEGGEWRTASYELADGFRPSGATTLPNGDVLVLERSFSFPATLRARFVRITPHPLEEQTIRGTEIARLEAPFPVDNFEAIAAFADSEDRVFVYVLSDDNFSLFQRTLILKFEVTS